ncbi:MAG TPA: UPF0175 family protein [Tepidisphaeraceae bacterium]|nr:UPF0175 family protein [Tepidisphaeraceae bacterium]
MGREVLIRAGSGPQRRGGDGGRLAIERIALDGYRAGELTRFELQQLLGFDNRWDVEQWLAERDVPHEYSVADLHKDRETLNRILTEK